MVLRSCKGAVFTFPAVCVQPRAGTVLVQVGPCDGVAGLGNSENSRKEPQLERTARIPHPHPKCLREERRDKIPAQERQQSQETGGKVPGSRTSGKGKGRSRTPLLSRFAVTTFSYLCGTSYSKWNYLEGEYIFLGDTE